MLLIVEMAKRLKDRGSLALPHLLAWVLLTLFVTAGCAAGVRTSLVEMDMRLASPLLSRSAKGSAELPVVYPAAPSVIPLAAGAFPLEEQGPAWRGLEPVYSQYRFNPFNP